MSRMKQSLSITILFLVALCQSSTIAANGGVDEASYTPLAAQLRSEAPVDGQRNVDAAGERSASLDASGRDPKLDPRRWLQGILVYRDAAWGYSFLWPQHWQRYQMKGLTGAIYAPGDDPRTGFYLFLRDMSGELDGPVTASYVVERQREIRAELNDLPNIEILDQQWITKGPAMGFEILFTFGREGETYKRLMRVLYHGKTRYTIYEQGASLYEYDVFYDTFEFMYSSFTFGDLMVLSGLYVGE